MLVKGCKALLNMSLYATIQNRIRDITESMKDPRDLSRSSLHWSLLICFRS